MRTFLYFIFLASCIKAQTPEYKKGVKWESTAICSYGENDSTGLKKEVEKFYNRKGFLNMEVTDEADSTGGNHDSVYYSYNKKGYITSTGTIHNKVKTPDKVYEYDKNNRLMKETRNFSDKEYRTVKMYVYDREGKLIRTETSMLAGERFVENVYYSTGGKKTMLITEFFKGSNSTSITKEYFDDSGKKILVKYRAVKDGPAFQTIDSVVFRREEGLLYEEHFNVIFRNQTEAYSAHYESQLNSRKIYNRADSVIREERFTYDNYNWMSSTKEIPHGLSYRVINYRNENQQLVLQNEYMPSWGLSGKDTIPYRQTWFTQTGKISKIKYGDITEERTYNELDQLVESSMKDNMDNQVWARFYYYSGAQLAETRYFENSKLVEREVYSTGFYAD